MEKIDFQIALGKRIRQLREEKKMSQAELALLCHFDKPNMNRIETGKTCPSSFTLYKISISLEVKLSEITNVIE
ncbi:helix-turn-helix domain-containing protein [Chryseobacterium taichungense]|uniref:helix-turn-helix domain-containing protein n=1 Tax=Chryseobacterium taichungense TaxID=295069 RepID=UPI0028ACDE0A|nr:helix-turn-helix transcriptional regulator [Chryseobacterium taichungense]